MFDAVPDLKANKKVVINVLDAIEKLCEED
jgi:hypothetical protein